MCVSSSLAEFSGTILYTGRRNHPDYGLIHVLGYQNTAANLVHGPNAMLLHVPAVQMTQANFVPVGDNHEVLRSMVRTLTLAGERAAGRAVPAGGRRSAPAEIFDHDIYTVVLAPDASAIPAALQHVPSHKRPQVNSALLDFYVQFYPGYPIALCCFDNADAQRAKPLLMWYPPLDPELLQAPALDCHTGEPPELRADVPVDHWVIFGTDEIAGGWGVAMEYSARARAELGNYLPNAVLGREFSGRTMPNGDFAISHSDLLAGRLDRIGRYAPVG